MIFRKKNEYQIIVDYVEGRLPAEEFHKQFLTNKFLQRVLQNKMSSRYTFLSAYDYSLYNYLLNEWQFVHRKWNSFTIQNMLQEVLTAYLDDNNIKYNLYPKYAEEYIFLLSIQPSWLDIDDDFIFQQIMQEIPQDLPKTQRIKMGKEKIKAMFKYDKTYPRWIQDPEWPIVNGKPLVFSHQERVKGDDFHTLYYFYDEDTKEVTVIEQFS